MSLNEQQLVRRENLNKIKAAGVDPFPPELFEITHFAKQIKSDFLEGSTKFKHVKLAGRLMMKRLMGKASFAELQDSSGKIQIYVARDEICPDPENRTFYNGVFSKWMDIGDFIGIEGHVFKTRTGETTVHVEKLVLLSKSLNPLPVVKVDSEGVVHDALTDPEIRYRQRYIDLLVNPRIKEIFKKRSQLITAMRNFFDEKGWLEVETPILQPIHGGAAARPFKTHHNSLDMTLYLRIANELYLKRLIVGGYDGVYEIGKMFRNEGMDRTHNPEFTALEIYVAYKDYNWMMEMVEQLLEKIAIKLHHTTKVTYGEHILDFKGPYPRMSMYEAIQKYIQVDISDMDENQLRVLCREQHVEVDNTMGRGKLIDELFGEKVEDHLIQPTYITDYPIEMTPLAKKHRTVDGLVERFELFVNGKEIANAYTELNDPLDQRARFEEQLVLANRGDAEAMALDDDYLLALEHGMPPTSGLGIGIDRLVMLMTDQHSIQEVLFFPQMKSKE